jgi:hypothetical protein
MNNNKVIESYKSNFKSLLGAYLYMHLNQNTPEFFVLSSEGSSDLTKKLENILLNAEDLNSVTKQIKDIPEELFKAVQEQNSENDLSQAAMLRSIGNLKYLSIDWNANSWEELNGFIDYNHYTPFIANKDQLQNKLKENVEKYSLLSFALNPNFAPDEFLKNFDTGINSMCDVLNINPKQIGLNALHINYKTEDGDFTGYVTSNDQTAYESHISNKMVINKPEVFAHEWMHFVESTLGTRGWALTDLMDHPNLEVFKKHFPGYTEVFKFKEVINKQDNIYSEQSLADSLKSAAHFYERYALDSSNFHTNIEKIAEEFKENYKSGKSTEDCLNNFEESIKGLLQERHPPRYFSFLKAQCEIYIDRENKKQLEKNQLMDFAKRSDEHLKLDDYTQSTIETFARTFESFVHDKLKTTGKECCLVSSSYDSDFYPQADMKKNLNSLWEKMWSQIKTGIDKEMPLNEKNLNKDYVISNISNFRKQFEKEDTKSLKLR